MFGAQLSPEEYGENDDGHYPCFTGLVNLPLLREEWGEWTARQIESIFYMGGGEKYARRRKVKLREETGKRPLPPFSPSDIFPFYLFLFLPNLTFFLLSSFKQDDLLKKEKS